MVHILKRMRRLDERLLKIRNGTGAARLPPPSTQHPLVTAIHLIHPWGGGTFTPKYHGSRVFWRNILPRLKFYNPALSITVTHEKVPGTIKTGSVQGEGTTGSIILQETQKVEAEAEAASKDGKGKLTESDAETLLTVHFDDNITSFAEGKVYEDYIPTNSTASSTLPQTSNKSSTVSQSNEEQPTSTRTASLSLEHKSSHEIYLWLKDQTGLIDVEENEGDKMRRDELATFKSKAEMDRRMVKKAMDAKRAHDDMLKKAKGDAERMRAEGA